MLNRNATISYRIVGGPFTLYFFYTSSCFSHGGILFAQRASRQGDNVENEVITFLNNYTSVALEQGPSAVAPYQWMQD